MPPRAPCGPRTGISNVFHILPDPYGARAGPARVPYGYLTETYGKWHNQNFLNSLTGVVLRTGPSRFPHCHFTGYLRSLNPYGTRKLTMHTLKHYGPPTGRQDSYGAARVPYGPREWTYDLCSKQPGNSLGAAPTGPGNVMWLGHHPTALREPTGYTCKTWCIQVNNTTKYTYFDEVAVADRFLHVHVHVLSVTKNL